MGISYDSNSFKSANENSSEEKKFQPIDGKVIVRKKGALKKFFDNILSDEPDSVKTYVIQEVLIPGIKKAISDIISNGTDIILYGETRKNKPSSNTTGSRISYGSYSSYYSQPQKSESAKKDSNEFGQDIILDTRGRAENVLLQLEEAIERYKMVSIADLNDILGITGSYTDCKYGWYDLSTAQIIRVKEGFLIKLPRVKPLN